MTEFDEEFEDENEDEGQNQKPVLDRNIRAQLKRASEQTKELEALKGQLAEQQRNSVFDKAGIPEDGLGTMFRKGYEGDVSVEAVRKTAVDYGLLNPTSRTNDDTSNDSELEALRRTQGATTGGDGNAPDAEQLYLTAIDAANSPEDVMKAVETDGRKVGVYRTGAL